MGESKTKFAQKRRANRPRLTVAPNPATGEALIHWHAAPTDELFRHASGTFNVSALYQIARANPRVCGPERVTLTAPALEFLNGTVDVDMDYAMSLSLADALAEPLLAIVQPSGETLFIDGHHRIARLS